jgi:hypothetical protein
MNIVENIFWRTGSAAQSGAHSTTTSISRWIRATLATWLIFLCGGAKAYNILINPGAETGDLTGWNLLPTDYFWVESTNNLVPGTASEHILAHSGEFVFQSFNTAAGSSYIYQDFAAIAGSQWSASCYAICYASNYFQSGASAHMQVVFYDASNNVVPYPSAVGGTFGSDFLDPDGSPDSSFNWIIAPPMAVDATGWVYLQATNLYDTDPAAEISFDQSLVTSTLSAPPGTVKVRYQIEFDNSTTGTGAVYWDDCDLEKLNYTDPDITNTPVAETVHAGSPASFKVAAIHTQAGEKLQYQWQLNGTNLPPAGANDISSSTTDATLAFTNCQAVDAGLYDVVVTVTSATYTNSIRSVPVALTVIISPPSYPVYGNRLGNPGFEQAPVWSPWNMFNGAYFASAASDYGVSSTPVNVFDGNWVALAGANGDRNNGFYQQITNVMPGSIWKAGGWACISSLNDFIGGNSCRIQVWFTDSSGNTIPGTPTYESFKIYGLGYTNADAQYTNIDTSSLNFGQIGYHALLPRDQWVLLPVTNVVNNAGTGLGDDLPTNTLPNGDFAAPTNANVAEIHFQVYEYCPVSADNPQADLLGSVIDAVYWDDMDLFEVLPTTNLTASVSGNNVNLTFGAGAGLAYSILYKTNLADAAWNLLSNNIAAPASWQMNPDATVTNYPITVSDAVSGQQSRYYRVQSQ